MMVDVSMFIGKAALIDATGNYGTVAQFKDASWFFVEWRAVSECSKVGSVGAARYGSGAFFCMDEQELDAIYANPNTVVCTDGCCGSHSTRTSAPAGALPAPPST